MEFIFFRAQIVIEARPHPYILDHGDDDVSSVVRPLLSLGGWGERETLRTASRQECIDVRNRRYTSASVQLCGGTLTRFSRVASRRCSLIKSTLPMYGSSSFLRPPARTKSTLFFFFFPLRVLRWAGEFQTCCFCRFIFAGYWLSRASYTSGLRFVSRA